MCAVFGPQPVMDIQIKIFMWGIKGVCWERYWRGICFSINNNSEGLGPWVPGDRADWTPSLGVGWVKEIVTSHSQPLPQLRTGSVRSRSDFCSCLNLVFLLPSSPCHANVCVRDPELEDLSSSLPLYCFSRQNVRGISVTVFALLPHCLVEGTCCVLLAGLSMHFRK